MLLKPICAENPQIICANMLLKPICAENPCTMTTDKKPAEDNPAAGKPKNTLISLLRSVGRL